MYGDTLGRFLTAAFSAVGREYIWGGTNLSKGVDCSGLVYSALLYAGYQPPRVASDLHRWTQRISMDQAQPGDLVFWDASDRPGIDHTGIYLGNGKALEASSSQDRVVVRNLWGNPSFGRITAQQTAPNNNIVMGPNLANAQQMAAAIAGGSAGYEGTESAPPPPNDVEGSTDPYQVVSRVIDAARPGTVEEGFTDESTRRPAPETKAEGTKRFGRARKTRFTRSETI